MGAEKEALERAAERLAADTEQDVESARAIVFATVSSDEVASLYRKHLMEALLPAAYVETQHQLERGLSDHVEIGEAVHERLRGSALTPTVVAQVEARVDAEIATLLRERATDES